MAKSIGDYRLPGSILVEKQQALDPRVVVERKLDLITAENWPHEGQQFYLYEGLVVSVIEEQALYMLINLEEAVAPDYRGWVRIDGNGEAGVEVLDTLESDAADKALSANKGKELKIMLDGKADLDPETGRLVAEQLPDFVMGALMFGGLLVSSGLDGDAYGYGVISPSGQFKAKFGVTDDRITLHVADAPLYEGVYFISSVTHGTKVLGLNGVKTGDWVVSTGQVWSVVGGNSGVSSVAGLTGVISADALASKLTDPSVKTGIATRDMVKAIVRDVQTDTYIVVETDPDTGALKMIRTSETFGDIVAKVWNFIDIAAKMQVNLNNLSKTVGNLNILINGDDEAEEGTQENIGLLQRVEELEKNADWIIVE